MPVLSEQRLFKIVMRGHFNTTECINRFWYVDDVPQAIAHSPFDVADAFKAEVADEVLARVSNAYGLDYIRVERYQIGAPVAVATRTYTATNGAITGDVMPVFNAIGVRLNGETLETHPGSKRFAGVPETYNDSGYLNSTGETAAGNIATACQTGLEPQTDEFIFPCIVRDVVYPLGVRTPLPINEWVWNAVIEANYVLPVRHQTSRDVSLI